MSKKTDPAPGAPAPAPLPSGLKPLPGKKPSLDEVLSPPAATSSYPESPLPGGSWPEAPASWAAYDSGRGAARIIAGPRDPARVYTSLSATMAPGERARHESRLRRRGWRPCEDQAVHNRFNPSAVVWEAPSSARARAEGWRLYRHLKRPEIGAMLYRRYYSENAPGARSRVKMCEWLDAAFQLSVVIAGFDIAPMTTRLRGEGGVPNRVREDGILRGLCARAAEVRAAKNV